MAKLISMEIAVSTSCYRSDGIENIFLLLPPPPSLQPRSCFFIMADTNDVVEGQKISRPMEQYFVLLLRT